MESPFRYPKYPIFLFFLLGLIFSAFLLQGPLTSKIVVGSVLTIMSTLSGWGFAFSIGTFLHRIVDNPVNTNKLVVGRTYWLNGDTPARYLGPDEYTGMLNFHISGLDDPHHLDQGQRLYPGHVRLYFSENPEVTINGK